MGDLLCLFTGTPPSGRVLTWNDTEIGSIWDLSVLMGYRCMRILLWWLLCNGIFCGPLRVVDGSSLYEDPAEVRSADRPCALDMCNTTRSFTHESNTCVIRRWLFLILGCIDLVSCIRSSLYEDPTEVRYRETLCTWTVQHSQEFHTRVQYMCNEKVGVPNYWLHWPTVLYPALSTLLSTIFGWSAWSWHSPRTQLKYKRSRVCFSALLSVCVQHRACVIIPCPTFSSYNPELLSAFLMILSKRKASFRKKFSLWKARVFRYIVCWSWTDWPVYRSTHRGETEQTNLPLWWRAGIRSIFGNTCACKLPVRQCTELADSSKIPEVADWAEL